MENTIEYESYVSLSIARKLKDAGFDWPVRSFYQDPIPGSHLDQIFRDNPDKYNIRHDLPFSKEDWNHKKMNDRIYYSCPTLAVVQRWLREEKQIYVDASFARGPRDFVVIYIDGRIGGYAGQLDKRGLLSYEEALEFGISNALYWLGIPF